MTISPIQQIVAAIRQEMVSAVGSPENRPPRRATMLRTPQHERVAPAGLQTTMARRVRAISKDDPDRGRKAFRVFLESLLLTELGEELINDPEFHLLVDRVQQQMEANGQVASQIDLAIRHLLAEP
ncbi:hypothetical protein [Parachitinimonas caeni]|uniref:Uncharacterized protein n=1 Tax=Parachitinimonas caeni TaxID=3031301 RepID=A0ABT7E4P8_9NEIS|nr:hypothetical protein [Parachitinimonas caeni]MDK2125892.1 hypothetical protein [Parachitinimonas caeni]